LSDEEKNAIEQQLRLLQDNPGELLKRKFKYQYEQHGGAGDSGEQRW
jgi:predicted Zn-dependent peptidase